MNFNQLKLRIKIFFLLLFRRIKRKSNCIELDRSGHGSRNVLLILPFDENMFRVSAYSLRHLDVFSESNFFFVISDSNKDVFYRKKGETFFIHLSHNKDVVNGSEFLKFLNKYDFDMVVNFNIDFNLSLSRHISRCNAAYKVGFKSDYSDIFYNFQLDLSRSGTIEKGFLRVKQLISSI